MKLCSDVFWLRPGLVTSAQASVVVTGGEDGGSVRVARALLVADSGLLRAALEEGEVESRVHVAGVAGATLELYAEMLQHGDSMSIVSQEELWALLTLLEILRSSHHGNITLVVDKSNNVKNQNYTCLKRKITNASEALSPRKKNKMDGFDDSLKKYCKENNLHPTFQHSFLGNRARVVLTVGGKSVYVMSRSQETVQQIRKRASQKWMETHAKEVKSNEDMFGLDLVKSFTLISQAGPSHNPNFVMGVNFNGVQCTGCGGSKKIAKQAAARSALESIDLPNRNDCDIKDAMNNDDDGHCWSALHKMC